jgi:RimJ/RimL family protein N-acetyltransferase
MAHPFWPLFDLVVRTPRLELRSPDDGMCVELAKASGMDMFPDGEVHFLMNWLSRESPQRERESMQWWWRQRAEWTPERWDLTMAVVVDGRPVGVQDLGAKAFPLKRSVSTGSWLSAPYQGRGLGREMREAVLHLAFDGLGARQAHSDAFEGNERSLRVSRGVGYEENGERIKLRAGSIPTRAIGFRMGRERFEPRRRQDIVIENLEPCLPMFGLGPDLEPLDKATSQQTADQ